MNALRALWTVLATAGLLVSGIFVSSIVARAETDQNSVLYGEDNRLDLYDVEDPTVKNLARSTALIASKQNLITEVIAKDADLFQLRNESFESSYNLCSDERFKEQPLAGFCSSFLVGPNTMVTAGHCMTSAFECKTSIFVFDYHYETSDKDPTTIKKDQVYLCKSVIKRTLDPQTGVDFAVIELDRPVTDRQPLRFRKEGQLADNTPLTVIGNPLGLPTKIASGAMVRHNQDLHSFVANLDSYQGSSGSAVFNTNTGDVEGILVRGEDDFDFDEINHCQRSKRCENEACRGESVIRASVFAEYIPL